MLQLSGYITIFQLPIFKDNSPQTRLICVHWNALTTQDNLLSNDALTLLQNNKLCLTIFTSAKSYRAIRKIYYQTTKRKWPLHTQLIFLSEVDYSQSVMKWYKTQDVKEITKLTFIDSDPQRLQSLSKCVFADSTKPLITTRFYLPPLNIQKQITDTCLYPSC